MQIWAEEVLESARRTSTIERVGWEDLTYNEYPVKIFGDRWESYSGQEDQDVQNAMEWPHREDEPMKTYPYLFASQSS